MTKDIKYISWDKFQRRSSWYENQRFYGMIKRIKSVLIGIPLDLVIPFTYGSITYIIKKVFGEHIKITLNNEDW